MMIWPHYVDLIVTVEQWLCPPGSTLHVTQMRNQELFRSLHYACLSRMCVLILRASSVRKACAPVRTRAVCFGLNTNLMSSLASAKHVEATKDNYFLYKCISVILFSLETIFLSRLFYFL